jgi:hypothetical protein
MIEDESNGIIAAKRKRNHYGVLSSEDDKQNSIVACLPHDP